ncbi:hypothetical protein SBV1_770042 [Verrucomicrobia bacterium]|nr:hypothetical protein SBV1_770042 [Verrucomicrobiota bacterium]
MFERHGNFPSPNFRPEFSTPWQLPGRLSPRLAPARDDPEFFLRDGQAPERRRHAMTPTERFAGLGICRNCHTRGSIHRLRNSGLGSGPGLFRVSAGSCSAC